MKLFEFRLNSACEKRAASLIEEAAARAGLRATMMGTLSKYPGCIHWHFKHGEQRGILEATYWPKERRAWLSTRVGREADWIPAAIHSMLEYMAESCG